MHDPQTIADGARTPSASPLTFAHIKEMACDIVTASDKTLLEIARFYLERMKVLVEPTGCLSLAPIWEGTVPVKGKKIGVVISGGNTDVRNLYRKS